MGGGSQMLFMNIIFVDNVPATHDIWVAGDGEGVMAKLYPIMQWMKPSQGRRGIYLHEAYDLLLAISQKNSLTRKFPCKNYKSNYKTNQ